MVWITAKKNPPNGLKIQTIGGIFLAAIQTIGGILKKQSFKRFAALKKPFKNCPGKS